MTAPERNARAQPQRGRRAETGRAGSPVRVVAAVIRRGGELLLTQRPPGGPLGLMWEFPGGKLEPGETPELALVREIHEELGVQAEPLGALGVERHAYPHGLEVEIAFIEAAVASFAFRPGHGVHALRWVRPEHIVPDQLLEADREFVRRLAAQNVPARDPRAESAHEG
jgi:8-oxo-dGTP diphosphatase